jgi:polar amino acid transport system permease protein
MLTNQIGWIHVQYLLNGALWTVILSLLAFTGGGILGLILALMRTSSNSIARLLASIYITVVQGTPLLILMFLTYFGLSLMGFNLPAIVAAGASLTIYAAAYLSEIWRGAIESVSKTQLEAADSLGFSLLQTMALIVIPQAIKVATPPTVGFMVQIIKNTSIASIVGFADLTYNGKIINNSTAQPFLIYMIVAAIYLSLCYPLSRYSRMLERKMNVAIS